MNQKGISSILIILIIVGVLAVAGGIYWWQKSKSVPTGGDYYQGLSKACQSKSSISCCLSSVEEMKKNSYKLADNGKCEDGYTKNTMKCKDSYEWCESEVGDTANWKTYRNEEYGFEVKYPGNWEVLIAKTEGSIFKTFYFKDFKSGSPQNEYLMISISIGPNSKGLIIDEWLTIETNKKPVYQKTGEAIVGGQKALILNTSPAVSGSGSTYIFGNEKRNFIYAVSYFSATEKIFNQIFSTFKFIK